MASQVGSAQAIARRPGRWPRSFSLWSAVTTPHEAKHLRRSPPSRRARRPAPVAGRHGGRPRRRSRPTARRPASREPSARGRPYPPACPRTRRPVRSSPAWSPSCSSSAWRAVVTTTSRRPPATAAPPPPTAADRRDDYGDTTGGEPTARRADGTIVAEDFSLTDVTVAPGEEIVLQNDGDAVPHRDLRRGGVFDLEAGRGRDVRRRAPPRWSPARTPSTARSTPP